MAQSFPDLPISKEWLNAAAVYPELAGKKVTAQYKGGYEGYAYFGVPGTPPRGGDGGLLRTGMSVTGTADALWLCGLMGGTFYLQIED
ncbi:MAG: hypothetical protein E2598_07435 [Sphingobium sp.]|nr:hypothetical protein [Sphingobium sp.]